MSLGVDAPETAWARQNLDADRSAGLSDPEPGDEPGVVASAVFDGIYPFHIDVTGTPTGDPLPEALLYGAGESYELELVADGSACPPTSCEVPVTRRRRRHGHRRGGRRHRHGHVHPADQLLRRVTRQRGRRRHRHDHRHGRR